MNWAFCLVMFWAPFENRYFITPVFVAVPAVGIMLSKLRKRRYLYVPLLLFSIIVIFNDYWWCFNYNTERNLRIAVEMFTSGEANPVIEVDRKDFVEVFQTYRNIDVIFGKDKMLDIWRIDNYKNTLHPVREINQEKFTLMNRSELGKLFQANRSTFIETPKVIRSRYINFGEQHNHEKYIGRLPDRDSYQPEELPTGFLINIRYLDDDFRLIELLQDGLPTTMRISFSFWCRSTKGTKVELQKVSENGFPLQVRIPQECISGIGFDLDTNDGVTVEDYWIDFEDSGTR